MLRWPRSASVSSAAAACDKAPSRDHSNAALNAVKRLSRSKFTVGQGAAELRGAQQDAPRVVQGQAMQALPQRLTQIGQPQAAASAAKCGQQMGLLNERAHQLEREVSQASRGLKVALDGSDRSLRSPGFTDLNTVNSWYRRIFNDRTGSAAAPSLPAGRHWRGLRLAFNC